MEEEIIKKLKENLELSIEELNYLYTFNNYYTLVNIFGIEHVARTPDEITMDTICYVGDLYIIKKLPTYNLKYLFGMLNYNLDKVYNLDNLVYIGYIAYFDKLKDATGLENLRYIKSNVFFDNLEVSTGLDSLEYIGRNAEFGSLRDASCLSSLEYIGRDAVFPNLENADGLENIKMIVRKENFNGSTLIDFRKRGKCYGKRERNNKKIKR